MKKWKRVFSMLLVCCMVLSLLPTATLAASNCVISDVRGETRTFSSDSGTSAAIKSDGSLYMWGGNALGQVGNGTQVDQLEPIKVLDNVTSVTVWNSRSAAITADGSLYMWGWNSSGQIGNGADSLQLTPFKMMDDVTSVSLGAGHNAAITTDGSLYMWGYNTEGQIGNGTTDTEGQSTPVKVLDQVVSASLGSMHSAAITADGSLYMWGSNTYGEVGNNSTEKQTTPVKVLSNVAHVKLWSSISAAITTDGSLYMWGNIAEMLGTQTETSQMIPYPSPVKILDGVVSVDFGATSNAGSQMCAAITTNGELYAWGGYVGDGTYNKYTSPQKVMENVQAVSCGTYHSMAITTDGSLYTWGHNYTGQIGNGRAGNDGSLAGEYNVLTPLKILSNAAYAYAGAFSAAITSDGKLYTWGRNADGQTGTGTDIGNQTTPYLVLENVALPGAEEPQQPTPVPEPGASADITALYPASGTTFDFADSSADTRPRIFFDREVAGTSGRAQLDFSVGTLSVYRASDDGLIYQVEESSVTEGTSTGVVLWSVDGSPTAVRLEDVTTVLDYNTEYYVTMPAGFIKFADGTASPAIEKGSWSFTTIAEVEEEVEYAPPLVKSGQFQFMSDIIDGGDMTYDYNYDESWFFEDSAQYQHNLVKMSIRAALAAYGADGINSTPKNIEALMGDLEFTNIQPNYPAPSATTIGYAIGSKNIVSDSGEKCALVMVAVRGGGYYAEWGGNFNVGPLSEHRGFLQAAEQVLTALEQYISTNSSTLSKNIKVWIMGYSRGAATTNLVAKYLDDGAISGIEKENIFAFCFECPQNTTNPDASNEKYSNITNIANPNDIVPKVPMSSWGYTRYGKTYYTPYREGLIGSLYSTQKQSMEEQYNRLLHYAYGNSMKDASEFMEEFIGQSWATEKLTDALAFAFGDQMNYTSKWEATVMQLATKTLGKASSKNALQQFFDGLIDFMGPQKTILLLNLADVVCTDVAYAHYGELCLAWLDSLEGEFSYTNPKYRILFVNCPVNVSIYDSSGTLVGNIEDNIVYEIEDGVAAYIDADGQKVIALPNDEEYTIKMTATDDGTVTYTATQYNMDSGTTERLVSYYEVEIAEGDQLTGIVENLDQVSTAAYPLYVNESTESLTPDIEQSGDSVQKFDVTVSAVGNGAVTGGGNYMNGEYAKVTAVADSGEEFLGWYVDGLKVSADAEYRFLVTEDTNITAQFTAYAPRTHTTVSGQSFEISVAGVESECAVVLALYQEGRMVEVHMETWAGTSIEIETSQSYDTAKVMLLDPQYAPLCSAEAIER